MQWNCDLRENFAVNEITLLQILNYLPVQLKGTFHPFLIQVPFPLVPKIQITMLMIFFFFNRCVNFFSPRGGHLPNTFLVLKEHQYDQWKVGKVGTPRKRLALLVAESST